MKTAEQLDAEIKSIDRDVAGRERRLSMIRQHRERLYRERLALDAQVEVLDEEAEERRYIDSHLMLSRPDERPADKFAERDTSEMRKPLGKCVNFDGWDV